MENDDVVLVGSPCGHHGSYTFYKAFKYTKNNVKRIVTLGEFFFVKLWIDSDLLCIGELQLLWIDKNSEQMLASLRLYFLPENTPLGRMDHGEDEVVAIAEKVVIKVEDLVTWITEDAEWTWGYSPPISEPDEKNADQQEKLPTFSLTDSSLDFSDVEKERKLLDCNWNNKGLTVVILSYPRYCRYRAMLKRLENVQDQYLKYKIVNALGGFPCTTKNTRILFCRETFEYPELEGHELLCNHLAPKLKGRPRGKRKKRSVSPGSESNESESSVSFTFPSTSTKAKITTTGGRNGLRCNTTTSPRRSARSLENSESKTFIKKLNVFMKANQTPIGRIPSLGYKELDLHEFFTKVQKLGGYDAVTVNRLWKSIFDDLSGHQSSTSAATIVRRHYEKYLLPYECHIKGLEYKTISAAERRLLKCRLESSSIERKAEVPSTSSSASDPVPTKTSSTFNEEKKLEVQTIKTEVKPSSLRSVRVKPERQKTITTNTDFNNKNSANNSVKTEPIIKQEEDEEPPEVIECKVEITVRDEPLKPEPESEDDKSGVIIEKIDCDVTVIEDDDDDVIDPPPIEITEIPPSSRKLDSLNEQLKQPKEETKDRNGSYKELNLFIHEVKKRKLDILKEGGLEVTPVRPSVIQQVSVTKVNSNQPPQQPINGVKRLSISQNLTQLKEAVPPPKVVQSRSIYSYSEKTVYGNPKDIFMASEIHSVTPKMANRNVPRQTGGDLLDLSVTSPQKPVVEIMRIPQMLPPAPPASSSSSSSSSSSYSPYNRESVTKKLYNNPGPTRLGSNLEITLVAPQTKVTPSYIPQNNKYYQTNNSKRVSSQNQKSNQDYSRFLKTSGSAKPTVDNTRTTSNNKTSSHSSNNLFKNPLPLQLPPGFSVTPFYDNHLKDIPPYLPSMFDPAYYTAFQQNFNLYARNSIPSAAMPLPTPEQMKFYTDIMAKTARLPPQFLYQKIPDSGNNKKS